MAEKKEGKLPPQGQGRLLRELERNLLLEESQAGDRDKDLSHHRTNILVKGSDICGDIQVSGDLLLSGDILGDISSDTKSNVTVQGTCKGNIKTGGNVTVFGSVEQGDITSSGAVTINGSFRGGGARANEKITVKGTFSGMLQSKEILLGANAEGMAEIIYEENISVEKGAKIQGRISMGKMSAEAKRTIPTTQQMKSTPEKT